MEIRLFGGFEVRGAGGTAAAFESQKVRALLAYLVAQEGRAFSREHVGAVLWSEHDAETARRNLRQALYNLRQALPELAERLRVDHDEVAFDARPGDEIDVVEFLAAHRRGIPAGGEVAVAPLRRAVELYRGEVLAGVHLSDAARFEDWLLGQQERLREAARQALAALVEHFAARGDYEEAIVHGRRLVELDPLSEAAHRELMRLWVLAGRRRRALAQYEELAESLSRELGVEPLPETRALHRSLLAEELPEGEDAPPRPTLGPFVPLAGREEELAALERSWQGVLDGGARLALVEGPPGIGKTRLVKTFLGRLTSRRQARVAQARCLDERPDAGGRPFRDLLAGLGALDEDEEEPISSAAAPAEACGEGGAELAAAAIERLRRTPGLPLVLFLDDFHWGGEDAWRQLADLLDRAAGLPLWLIAAGDDAPAGDAAPRRRLPDHPRVDRVRPRPLSGAAVHEIAVAVLGPGDDAGRLAAFLATASDGLPLAVVEHVHRLRDEGGLAAAGERRWSLARDFADGAGAGLPLEALIERRVRRLPTSTRRLLALAAVIGPTFDVELLQRSAHEHVAVVEIALETMLERHLARPVARRWSDSPRQRDLVLWAQGARRGEFELSHTLVRDAVLALLSTEERRRLEGAVEGARAARGGEPDDQKKKRTPR